MAERIKLAIVAGRFREPVDAVVSIPIGSNLVAEAHRAISAAGKKLILLDNTPTGMLPGTDYVSVVSTDNFGLGWDVPAIAAAAAIRSAGRAVPMTTVDLGNGAAAELANGELVKGVAAQLPFEQGIAAGVATILGLLGREPRHGSHCLGLP